MNYGQFLNMVPEYYLVLILLAVFVVDFIMHRSEKKLDTLYIVTVALLAVLQYALCSWLIPQKLLAVSMSPLQQ